MKKIFGIALLALFCVVLTGCGETDTVVVTPLPEDNRVKSQYAGDERMWDKIFDVKEPYKFDSVPFGVILPHHLVVASELAKFYAGLREVIDPSVIVLIGPDHFEVSDANISTCKTCVFETEKGDVYLDDDIVADLVTDKIAVYSDDLFLNEHSVNSHTPFIKKFFPDTEIVPIVLKWDATPEEAIKLSTWLDENLPDDALVIGSVDFSHYNPWEVADFHDQSSFATILNFDFKNVYDLEIDSPSTVYTVLDLMSRREGVDVKRLAHTNLAQFLSDYVAETTSHQFFAFYEKQDSPEEFLPLPKGNTEVKGVEDVQKNIVEDGKGVSILSFGNVPQDNTLGFMTSWLWDRAYDETTDLTTNKFLRDIRGAEDRFFVGTDFYVFDLIDNSCRKESRNGMTVAFCKYLESFDDKDKEDEMEETLNLNRESAEIVYLIYEFDGEGTELTKARKTTLKSLVGSGVDIVVGRGLKEIVPFENYKGGLIFYSLGDFVTDNKLVNELNDTSEGVILGLYITPNYYYIYTFPIDVINGYPKLMDFSVRTGFFAFFRGNASLGSAEVDARKGVIKLKR